MTALDDKLLAPALSLGDDVAQAGVDILSECTYGSDDLSVIKAMLGSTIIDGLTAILALLRSYGQAHASTVARSMFEALGDLFHLCSAADDGKAYFQRMEMSSALIRQDNAEDMIRRRLGDQHSAMTLAVAKDTAKDAKQTIAKLSGVGVAKERLRVSSRVNAPELSDEIVGLYTEFCLDAHHDMVSLRKRHFRGNELVIGDTLDLNSAFAPLACGTMIAVSAATPFRLFPRAVSIRYPTLLKVMDSATRGILHEWTTRTNRMMAEAGWQPDGSDVAGSRCGPGCNVWPLRTQRNAGAARLRRSSLAV